jgi:5-formyltetrahydrofolate cyclo-ligase
MQRKNDLRHEFKKRIQNLSPAEKQAADTAIQRHILSSPCYRDGSTLFCYVGVGDEIATLPLILQALADGKRVCCPRTLGNGLMEVRQIRGEADLAPGRHGLLEPNERCPLLAPEDIDFVVVPCLSCDPFGNRLGYGGGYYDRYLKRLRKNTALMAVCREKLLCQNLPSGPHDVGLGSYVTEAGVFSSLDNAL